MSFVFVFEFGAKIVKISLQSVQKQIFPPKKSKKGNDIETSEQLYSTAFSLPQITHYKVKRILATNKCYYKNDKTACKNCKKSVPLPNKLGGKFLLLLNFLCE